jgi:hypothetical protein
MFRKAYKPRGQSHLPNPPVGHLVLFIRFEVRKSLQEIGEALSGISKGFTGMVSVEKSDDIQT